MSSIAGNYGARRASVRHRVVALVNAMQGEHVAHDLGRACGSAYDLRDYDLRDYDLRDLDSMSLVELGLAFEDEFGVSFESVEFYGKLLDDVVDYIVANATPRLSPLGTGAMTVVADDPGLVAQLTTEGIRAALWSPELDVAEGGKILLALCHQRVSRAIRAQFTPASVLLLPISSFDEDYDSIVYTIGLVFATDYVDACHRNRQWVDMLRDKPDGMLRFTGSATDLRCRLHENIRANTSLELEISKGEWVSVADYCEVSVTAPSQEDWLGAFTIDGYAEAVGVLVAEDSRATPIGRERIQAAKRLRADFVENGPVRLVVKDGVLREAVVAGRNRAPEISEVINPAYGLHTLELGLGSNPGVGPLVDWAVNSQLNEGVGAVHLGFGEGITGAHMDFVIDQATVG